VHKLVVDVALLAARQVLLVRYRDPAAYDQQRGWFLPDDYLKPLEHPDDAAARILTEQAGLRGPAARLHHIESFGNGAWHLIFHYTAEIIRPLPVVPGPNTAEARWFSLTALPDRAEMAHEGWGLDVLRTILTRSAG
jgi:8-oxo-dGTP diphosphatase